MTTAFTVTVITGAGILLAAYENAPTFKKKEECFIDLVVNNFFIGPTEKHICIFFLECLFQYVCG